MFSLLEICLLQKLWKRLKEMAGEHMVNYMRWVCHWRGLGNHMDPDEKLPETKGIIRFIKL